MEQITAAVTFILSAGPYGFAALVLWLGYKRVWVWGKEYDRIADENKALKEANSQLRLERDEYKFQAWATTGMAERLAKTKKADQ